MEPVTAPEQLQGPCPFALIHDESLLLASAKMSTLWQRILHFDYSCRASNKCCNGCPEVFYLIFAQEKYWEQEQNKPQPIGVCWWHKVGFTLFSYLLPTLHLLAPVLPFQLRLSVTVDYQIQFSKELCEQWLLKNSVKCLWVFKINSKPCTKAHHIAQV